MKWTPKFIIASLLIIAAYWGYAQIDGNTPKDMTVRQKFIRSIYPVFKWVNGLSGKTQIMKAPANAAPVTPIYALTIELIDGQIFDLSACKGKKILFVNTASDCGFTPQYEGLQALHEKYGGQVVIIGVPSNEFKQQEKKDNNDIATFCKRNYGVSFLLASKANVRRGSAQHPVFRWLTDPEQNGWNGKAPSWNFAKYLVDEQGRLTYYFEPGVDPKEELFDKLLKG